MKSQEHEPLMSGLMPIFLGNERIIITGVCFSEVMNGVYYSMHDTKL